MLRMIALGLLLAELASAQAVPPPATREVRDATFAVHLTQGRDWEALPYETVRGVILLQATVNGQPATVLLDNGTDRTVVDAHFAERTGILLRDSSLAARAGQSRLKVRMADAVTLALPHTLTVRGQMPAIDLAPMSTALGRPIAAVVGGDLLNRVAVMVRPAKRQVAIVASGGITPGAGAIVVPVKNGNLVEAEINEKAVLLKIDLGSSGAIRLTDSAFERLFPASATRSSGSQVTADGFKRTTRVANADLRIGAAQARSVPIDSGYALGGADGLLGNGFLSRADTILDVQKGQLILTFARPAN